MPHIPTNGLDFVALMRCVYQCDDVCSRMDPLTCMGVFDRVGDGIGDPLVGTGRVEDCVECDR